MTSPLATTGADLIYTVLAEEVPVLISVYKVHGVYRIKFARGIGWAPDKYKTKEHAFKKLMSLKTYGKTEARLAKAICTQVP